MKHSEISFTSLNKAKVPKYYTTKLRNQKNIKNHINYDYCKVKTRHNKFKFKFKINIILKSNDSITLNLNPDVKAGFTINDLKKTLHGHWHDLQLWLDHCPDTQMNLTNKNTKTHMELYQSWAPNFSPDFSLIGITDKGYTNEKIHHKQISGIKRIGNLKLITLINLLTPTDTGRLEMQYIQLCPNHPDSFITNHHG